MLLDVKNERYIAKRVELKRLNMLSEILAKYDFQEVGINNSDMIISKENFISAVKELNSLGYCIDEVSWWSRNKIGNVLNDFSMGGPIDKNDKEYFFGETNYNKTFNNCNLTENLEQVINYYSEFVKADKYNLYPSITLNNAFKG